MTNPFAVLPEAARLYVYLVLTVVFLGLTAWLAADGNVLEALLAFVGSAGNLMAASNTGTSTNPFKTE